MDYTYLIFFLNNLCDGFKFWSRTTSRMQNTLVILKKSIKSQKIRCKKQPFN